MKSVLMYTGIVIALIAFSPVFGQDIPLPGEDSVPATGKQEGISLPGTGPSLKDKVKFSGYVENTFNLEYVHETGRESILNGTRARVNLSAKPDKHFDLNIGLVGNLYMGTTSYDLTNYLPSSISLQPGVENFFTYNFENEIVLQEAFGTLYVPFFRIRVGRQKYYTGNGYAFNPTDLFNTKNVLDPTYETDGIDAVFMSLDLPAQVEIHGVIRFGENFSTTDYLARLKFQVGGWDFGVQYTRWNQVRYDYGYINTVLSAKTRTFIWDFVGAQFSGEIVGIHLYAEGGYAFIHAKNSRGTISNGDQDHERVLVGVDYTFDFQLYIMVEYLRYGQGRANADDITLNDRLAYYSGEMIAIGQDTIYGGISYPVTDLIDLSLYTMVGINDASAILIPWMNVSLFPGLKLSVAVNVPLGETSSQMGRMGPGGFIRLKYHF